MTRKQQQQKKTLTGHLRSKDQRRVDTGIYVTVNDEKVSRRFSIIANDIISSYQ